MAEEHNEEGNCGGIEKISNTELCIYVDSEISLKVFHCSTDSDFFKRNHPPLVAHQHVISQVTEGVKMRLCAYFSHIFPVTHIIFYSLFPITLNWLASNSQLSTHYYLKLI
jgi:hypothetical protein